MSQRRERGVALLSVLGLISLTLPLGAQLQLENQLEGWIAANARHHAQVLYTAEAGVAAALAVLRMIADPTAVEFGPDGVSGTEDDGLFPFPAGHTSEFPEPGFSYAVRIRRTGPAQFELASQASGPRRTRRTVIALVEVDDATNAPKVLGQRELR